MMSVDDAQTMVMRWFLFLINYHFKCIYDLNQKSVARLADKGAKVANLLSAKKLNSKKDDYHVF